MAAADALADAVAEVDAAGVALGQTRSGRSERGARRLLWG